MKNSSGRIFLDSASAVLARGAVLLPCFFLVLIISGLAAKSAPLLLSEHSFFSLVFSPQWKPYAGLFGFFPFIAGTVYVTALAVLLAVPPSVLCAIYLSEYAGKRLKKAALALLDLMVSIPSVVYGMWGIMTVVPAIRDHAAPFFGVVSPGYCVLAASFVLAVMIIPVITQVAFEVFQTVPEEMKEAAAFLGATKWETVKSVVLRKGLSGLLAGVFLGISRAFGETMAVLMLAGNVAAVPKSVWEPAYPLPALIANNYGEMLSVPGYEPALLFSALVLLLVVLVFQLLSRICLRGLGWSAK